MSRVEVDNVECIGCTDCVESCPVPTALYFGTQKHKIRPWQIAASLVLALVVATSVARWTGVWHNDLSDEEIRGHVAKMHQSTYGHPGMNE